MLAISVKVEAISESVDEAQQLVLPLGRLFSSSALTQHHLDSSHALSHLPKVQIKQRAGATTNACCVCLAKKSTFAMRCGFGRGFSSARRRIFSVCKRFLSFNRTYLRTHTSSSEHPTLEFICTYVCSGPRAYQRVCKSSQDLIRRSAAVQALPTSTPYRISSEVM